MRTGGTYTVEQLSQEDQLQLQLHCPWNKGLGRDWNRAEIISLARKESGLIHNHVINWDEELVSFCKNFGWSFFTIIRDPCEQLLSLWYFLGKPGSLNNFIDSQLNGELTISGEDTIDYHSWAIPYWWKSINHIIHYPKNESSLYANLKNIFNLEAEEIPSIINRANYTERLSTVSRLKIKGSYFYERYLDINSHENNIK